MILIAIIGMPALAAGILFLAATLTTQHEGMACTISFADGRGMWYVRISFWSPQCP